MTETTTGRKRETTENEERQEWTSSGQTTRPHQAHRRHHDRHKTTRQKRTQAENEKQQREKRTEKKNGRAVNKQAEKQTSQPLKSTEKANEEWAHIISRWRADKQQNNNNMQCHLIADTQQFANVRDCSRTTAFLSFSSKLFEK